MGCRAAIGLILWQTACGAPKGPPPPLPLAATTKRYAPLAARSDAKQPGLAVILGTSAQDDATVLALPAAPQRRTIDAMFVASGAGVGPRGGSIAVALTVSPTTGGPPVASTASEPRWDAGLWSAALVAAGALGKDVTDLSISAALAATADGLDSSALVAAGLVAALTGEPVDPAAAIAGTIDPDGTIGPTAGIPEQLRDAVAHGKTVFGYPSGMRFAASEVTGKDVDLVQLAADHHAQAVELATVADAYQLLTHRQLPAPLPVAEDDMALDRETVARLELQYQASQQRLAGEWAAMLELEQAGRLPSAIQLMVKLAHDRSSEAEALHRAGKLAAAYSRVLIAWVYAASANATNAVLAKLVAGDVAAAIAALSAVDTARSAASVMFGKLAAFQPVALAGQMAVLSALQATLRGEVFHGIAADAAATASQLLHGLAERPKAELGAASTTEPVAGAVAPAVLMVFRTLAELAVAEQELDLEVDRGAPYSCSPANLARLAAAYDAAAATELRYVDARLVEPLAARTGVSQDEARRQVASADPDYLVATSLARLPADRLPPELVAPGVDRCAMLPLALHELVYRDAARLITRYDALAVRTDDAGRATAVAAPAAFKSLLARARQAARASARAARIAAGTIPFEAKLAYQLAVVDEAGGVDDQLSALAELWTATAMSQAAAMLARN